MPGKTIEVSSYGCYRVSCWACHVEV